MIEANLSVLYNNLDVTEFRCEWFSDEVNADGQALYRIDIIVCGIVCVGVWFGTIRWTML